MATARKQKVSVASRPNYGPGKNQVNANQRKGSFANVNVRQTDGDYIEPKQLQWDSQSKTSACACDRYKTAILITSGVIVTAAGTVIAVVSPVNQYFRYAGYGLIGVGVIIVLTGVVLQVKNHKKRSIQLQDDEKDASIANDVGYVDPALGNISMADIEDAAAPDPTELYMSSNKGRKQRKSTKALDNAQTDDIKDFDADTLPGLVSIPAVTEALNAPLVAYPNMPRNQGDISLTSATYQMAMKQNAELH